MSAKYILGIDLGTTNSVLAYHPLGADISSWNRHMQILDAQLQRTAAYVAGAEFTLADIVLGLATHRWQMAPITRLKLDAVDDYYQRLSQRPAFLLHGRNGMP